MINKVKTFFRNLKLWFPILVDDQQWDDYYLHRVVHHKLKLMKDFYDSDKPMAVKEHTDEVSEEISWSIDALERIIDADYIKFPEGLEPDMKSEKISENLYTAEIIYHEDFGEEKVKEVYEKAEWEEKNDLKKAYGDIVDNSKKWWD